MKTVNTSNSLIQSPWTDRGMPNPYRDQFKLIADLKIDTWLADMGPYFTPIEIYKWIDDQNGQDLFFRGLARLAPMFPLISYKGDVAVWLSPPPSGLGNVICMVMAQDKHGQLRVVGGNYFSNISKQKGATVEGSKFFEKYDCANQRGKHDLVKNTVEISIQAKDIDLIRNVRRECEDFHTMPIYITALTNKGSLFHVGKALIEGVKPSNFSYEFFGEIK